MSDAEVNDEASSLEEVNKIICESLDIEYHQLDFLDPKTKNTYLIKFLEARFEVQKEYINEVAREEWRRNWEEFFLPLLIAFAFICLIYIFSNFEKIVMVFDYGFKCR